MSHGAACTRSNECDKVTRSLRRRLGRLDERRAREIARDLSIFSPRKVPTAFLRRCYIYVCEGRYYTLHAEAQRGGPSGERYTSPAERNREKIFHSRTFTRTHSGPSTEKRSSPAVPPRFASVSLVSTGRAPKDPYDRESGRRKFSRANYISDRLRIPDGIAAVYSVAFRKRGISWMILIYWRSYGP